MIFSAEAICRACKGTGLYVGIGERDGAAVVCSRCKGSGCERIVVDYEPFVARAAKPKVKRVYRTNCGFVIGQREGVCALDDFGGMPIADWLAGNPWPHGSEDRKHTCPAWWYQSADSKLQPKWDECGFGTFSDCSHFADKAECWARFDREKASIAGGASNG